VLIAIGVLVLFLGAAGFTILCCPKRRKCSLGVMMFLTIIAFALSGTSTGLGFYYDKVVKNAFDNSFGDKATEGWDAVEKAFYRGMRDAFQDLYKDCSPTAYDSTTVKKECDLAKDTMKEDEVETCSSEDYPSGYLGLYCKEGPGLSPFTVDKAMAFPDQEESLSLTDFIETRSFGYFANYVCMPTMARYEEMKRVAVDLASGVPAPPSPPGSSSTFSDCYSSDWWGDTPPLVKGSKFGPNDPDGDPLSPEQKVFFDALQLSAPGPQELNDKMVFCFCADEGTDSQLYGFLKKCSEYSKWISLGASIFFVLVFISECYLRCCYKDQSDRDKGNQLTVLRP